jgi:hypothetical protein
MGDKVVAPKTVSPMAPKPGLPPGLPGRTITDSLPTASVRAQLAGFSTLKATSMTQANKVKKPGMPY